MVSIKTLQCLHSQPEYKFHTGTMHVLIVGAGLGGLGLAQSLRKQGISFEIFERDDNENSRFQGWAIGLHT